MLRLDGRLALVRGLLRPSSELSGVGSRGADQLVGRKFERNAAEPGQRRPGLGPRAAIALRVAQRPSQDDEARRPVERSAGEQKEAPPYASSLFLLKLHMDVYEVYELCSATQPLRIGGVFSLFFTISSVIAPRD